MPKYNPQKVSAYAMSKLEPLMKDEVSFYRETYIPLPLSIQRAIKVIERERVNGR